MLRPFTPKHSPLPDYGEPNKCQYIFPDTKQQCPCVWIGNAMLSAAGPINECVCC